MKANDNGSKVTSGKFIHSAVRPGLIAEKIGMTSSFDQNGSVTPVTLLKIIPASVIAKKEVSTHGYSALVVGYGDVKEERLTKPMAGVFKKVGITPKAFVKEFRLGDDYSSDLSVLDASIFVEGQLVDVSGVSIGKGFAGVMKRWNFRGLEASHGVSVSHRSHGSTGQRQDPGKVFKGKKMAGHMGCEKVTVQNLKVVKIDLEGGVLVVKGNVPGANGGRVFITDARKKINIS